MDASLLFQSIPIHVISDNLIPYLSLLDIASLDSAFVNKNLRPDFLAAIKSVNIYRCSDYSMNNSIGLWIIRRQVKLNCMSIGCQTSMNMYEKLVAHNKDLVFIDLSMCELTNDMIDLISRYCQKLKHISISNNSSSFQISDDCVTTLAQSCPLLRSIDMSYHDDLSDASVIAIARSCSLLEQLDVSGCRHLSDASIKEVFRNCPRLRHVYLNGCSQITDSAWGNENLSHFEAAKLPISPLETLDLGCCALISDNGVKTLTSRYKNLTSFTLTGNEQITNQAVVSLATHSKNLRKLNLNRCSNIGDIALEALAGRQRVFSPLEELKLSHCAAISTDSPTIDRFLSTTGSLQRLDISGCGWLTGAHLQRLAATARSLRRLSVAYCDELSAEDLLEYLNTVSSSLAIVDVTECALVLAALLSAVSSLVVSTTVGTTAVAAAADDTGGTSTTAVPAQPLEEDVTKGDENRAPYSSNRPIMPAGKGDGTLGKQQSYEAQLNRLRFYVRRDSDGVGVTLERN